jgi:hypothetical protein
LFSGDNQILVKAFGCSKKSLSEPDSGNFFEMRAKGFPIFRLFPDDRIIVWPWDFLLQPNALTKIRLSPENKMNTDYSFVLGK